VDSFLRLWEGSGRAGAGAQPIYQDSRFIFVQVLAYKGGRAG
jgi:hypothetical protein